MFAEEIEGGSGLRKRREGKGEWIGIGKFG